MDEDAQLSPKIIRPPSLERERVLGAPNVSRSASRDWLLEGYRLALGRFHVASKRDDRSERDTFFPLFEALNWAVAIEYYVREREVRPIDHSIVRALRFARNRVHHQWALALEQRQQPTGKVAGLLATTGTTFDWFWIEVERLPPADERFDPKGEGEAAYAESLAGTPARNALDQLEALLTTVKTSN